MDSIHGSERPTPETGAGAGTAWRPAAKARNGLRSKLQRAIATAGRTALLAVLTALVIAPLGIVVTQGFTEFDPRTGRSAFSLDAVVGVFASGQVDQWFLNSLAVSLATVVATVAIAAPAGYVISRGRGRWVSAFSLGLFVLQTLPAVVLVVPLFLVFAQLGLVDDLLGLGIVYVGTTVAVGAWMMAAGIDSIPVAIEEAAWLDGCSVASGFVRVVLRNCASPLISVALFSFLQAWNEYMIAVVFLHAQENLTLGIAIAGAHPPALAVVMMAPPVLLFVLLHRHFRFGNGLGGAVTGA